MPAPKSKAPTKASTKTPRPKSGEPVKTPGKGPLVAVSRKPKTKRRTPSKPPTWKPVKTMHRDEAKGVIRLETDEEAMLRYKMLVAHYVANGTPIAIIGQFLQPPISEPTLRKYFAWEIEYASEARDAQVEGRMMAAINRGDGSMIRYYQGRVRKRAYKAEPEPIEGPDVGLVTADYDGTL